MTYVSNDNWISYLPAKGTVQPGTPSQITVQPNLTSLTTGYYRAVLTLAASGADSEGLGAIRDLHGPRHPALGGSLEAELALLLGDAWDAELEPFRHASAGAPVRWLHATG